MELNSDERPRGISLKFVTVETKHLKQYDKARSL